MTRLRAGFEGRLWPTLMAVAIGVSVAGCGGRPPPPSVAAPTADPVPAPSPSGVDASDWIEFDSPRHKYTIRHPPEWEVTAATADGGPDATESVDSDSFDRFVGDGVEFLARSHAIPGNTEQLYEWIDGYIARVRAADPGCYPPTNDWQDFAVQGYYGGPLANGCESIAVVGGPGHAWEFRLIGDPNPELFYRLLSWVFIDDESLGDP